MKRILIVLLALTTMMQAQERKHIPVASIQGRWIGKDCWVGENQESQKAIESMKIEFKGRKVSAWLNWRPPLFDPTLMRV